MAIFFFSQLMDDVPWFLRLSFYLPLFEQSILSFKKNLACPCCASDPG